jgi:hypothetical protein
MNLLDNPELFGRQVVELQRAANELIEKLGGFNGGACLIFANVVSKILSLPIVAGNASWQFQKDNGIDATHYSYVFGDARARAMAKLHPERMPEMHVWNILDGQVLDISTESISKVAKLEGYLWEPEFALPKFYLGPRAANGGKIIYRELFEATRVAREISEQLGLKTISLKS